MTLIAQLSDLHVTLDASKPPYVGRLDPRACLVRAVESVLQLDPAPAACLLTGDLVERGASDEYAALRDAIAPLEAAMPVFALPGNHDEREAMRAAFSRAAWMPAQGPIQYAVQIDVLRVLMCDSVVPGAAHGALDASRLAWIETQLEAAPRSPTIVAIHHPPFATGIAFMDRIALHEGAVEFDALLRRHAQVVRVICGHVHRPITASFGGTLATIAPSTAHQIPFELRDDAAEAFTIEPPGYALHWWNGQGLVTHTVPVRTFERVVY